MVRRVRNPSRATRRRQGAAANLVGLGLLFVLAPVILASTPLGAALRSLGTIGWLMLVTGGILLWFCREKSEALPQDIPAAPARAAPPASTRSSSTSSSSSPKLADLVKSLPTLQSANVPTTQTRPTVWTPDAFSAIEWRRFEALVEALFAQAGFETKSLSHGADDGVDIWLYSKNQPDGQPVSIVQCKHWKGKAVGVDKVRELRGVMAARNVRRGQFATTSTFTPDAVAFARDNGINLLDVEGMLRLIAQRSPEQQQALLDVAFEGDYWRPTCVNCGIKMLERTRRKDGSAFWGCCNYPRCKTTMQMRSA